MKAFATAAAIVGGVALAATGVGAFAGAAVVTATIGVSAATLGAIAGGLQLTSTVLAKKPKTSGGGAQIDWKADPQAGIPYAFGRTYVGGAIVYRQAWGKDNKWQTIHTVLSGGGPVASIDQLFIDDDPVAVGSDTTVAYNHGYVFERRQLGRSPEPTAIQVGQGGMPPGWTSAHKLSGYAATAMQFVFDTKGSTTMTSTPKCGWVGHWVKTYDPRKDSTYPGGSGAHRATDESTWEWSENPFLHALAWLIGRRQNGKVVLGVGVSLEDIIVSQFVEGANVADTNGWKIGGICYSTDNRWNVFKTMLQAGAAEPLQLGAQIGCLVSMPRVSLATIDGRSDVIGDVSVQATQPRRDRINAIVPRYRDEASNWETVPAAPIVVPEYVTFDGGKQRNREVEYSYCQDVKQAATLARYDIENAREFGPVTLPLKLRWMGYQPGDVVTVNDPESGLVAQNVLILSRTLSAADATVTFTCRSETAGKHPYALGQTTTPPPTASVQGPALVPTPGALAWRVTGGTLASDNGTTIPVLQVTGAPDSDVIDQVVFELRTSQTSNTQPGDWGLVSAQAPNAVEQFLNITGVKDATAYDVAVSYRKGPATGSRLILGPAVAGQTAVPWQTGVTGPGKPEDGATVGSPEGTYVGSGPTRMLAERVAQGIRDLDQAASDTSGAIQGIRDQLIAEGAEQAVINTRLAAGAQNFAQNGGFERGFEGIAGSDGWAVSNGLWGLAATTVKNGAGIMAWPAFSVQAGEWYSYTADSLLIADAGRVYIDCVVYDVPGGNVLVDGSQKPRAATHDFSSDGSGRAALAAEVQVPANAPDTAVIVPRFVYEDVAGCVSMGVREVMVARGRLPVPSYRSSLASVRQGYADIVENRLTIAGLSGSFSQYQLSVSAMFGGFAPSGLKATIDANRQAATDATQAVAQSVDTVSARIQTRPNLQKNGGFTNGTAGVDGPGAISDDPNWGRIFYHQNNGTTAVLLPPVNIDQNNPFTVSGDLCLFATSGTIRMDVACYSGPDGTGSVSYATSTPAYPANIDFGTTRREFTLPAGSGAQSLRVRMVTENVSGISRAAIRLVKVEQGAGPSTVYTDQATSIALAASVAQTAGAVALIGGKTKAFWQIRAVAGDGTATLGVLATDDNGNAYSRVLINATDVLIHANVFVDGTITARKFLTDQGVDLAALVPGTTNFRLPASWNGSVHLAGSDSTIQALTGIATVGGHTISGDVSVTIKSDVPAGSGEDNVGSMAVDVYLNYRVNGGAWQGVFVGTAGASNVSRTTTFAFGPIDTTWAGSTQFALYIGHNSATPAGTVYAASLNVRSVFAK